MVATDVNVLEQAVEIRGGNEHVPERWNGWVTVDNMTHWFGASRVDYIAREYVGPLGRELSAVVNLVVDGEEPVSRDFEFAAEALEEVGRLYGALFTRQWVEWATDHLRKAGVVPEELCGALLTGDPQALLIAADWQDDRGNGAAAMLCRSAHHMVRGECNVEVRAGKAVLVLNPREVSKKHAYRAGIGKPMAALVEPGRSVRIVSVFSRSEPLVHGYRTTVGIDDRTFRVGDRAEYGSYNLVYFAPITSITEKTVTIKEELSGTSAHRLTLAKFVRRS